MYNSAIKEMNDSVLLWTPAVFGGVTLCTVALPVLPWITVR